MQCCACSKWVDLRCSQLSLSKFRPLGNSHSWSCSPCCNTVTPSSDFSDMYTSSVQPAPPHPRLQTSCPYLTILHLLSLPPHHRSLLLAVLLRLLLPLPLTLSGFCNGMLEVFKPGALNLLHFFRPILSTLSVSSNPILIHLPLSGFSAPHSDRTHCRSAILSSGPTHASSGVAVFIRQGFSFSALSTSSLSSLDPYYDYVGVNISLNSPSLLSFLNVYPPLFALLRRMAEPTPFLPPFFPPSEISSFWGISIAITPLGLMRYFRPPRGGSI